MKLELQNIRWKNFNSYGEMWTSIDLNRSPLTVMSGLNGHGKCLHEDTELTIQSSKELIRKYKNFVIKSEQVKRALDTIGNIHKDAFKRFYNQAMLDQEIQNETQYKKILKLIKSNIFKDDRNLMINQITKPTYWVIRGHIREDEIKSLMKQNKKLSPFDYNFYIEKHGMTEEEAKYKANSIRPIKWEYWVERGLDKDQAVLKAKEQKSANTAKALNSKRGTSYSNDRRKLNHRCIEYWLIRGYDDDCARDMISIAQSTFSIKKCIDKYGEDEGRRIFNDRQSKWQSTLSLKTDVEKRAINYKKSKNVQTKGQTHIYVCSINVDGEDVLKVGVSSNVNNRMKQINGRLLHTFEGLNVCELEQMVFEQFVDHRFVTETNINGYTEMLKCDCLNHLLMFIEENLIK